MSSMKLELTLFDSRVTEDENGFICLNDIWRAAGSPTKLRPVWWRRILKVKALEEALLSEIMRLAHNLANSEVKSVVYSTGRGRGAKTFAHPIMALDYTEWLSPELGVEMRRVFLRYRANDLTLAEEMMDRIKSQVVVDKKRVEDREEFTYHYRFFRKCAHRAGCIEPRDYTFVNSGGYEGFYGGKTMTDVKTMKSLPVEASLPDHMGLKEGTANNFRIEMTVTRMDAEKPHNVASAYDHANWVGREVRDFMMRMGSPAPETLPASDHVRNARKRIKRYAALLKDEEGFEDLTEPKPKKIV